MRRNPDDPFDEILGEFERMLESALGLGDTGRLDTETGGPHVDVHEYDDRVVVIADIPGAEKEDIDLQSDGTVLSITARADGDRLAERVRLPAAVDEASARASYNNGVLEVTFERTDGSADISVE